MWSGEGWHTASCFIPLDKEMTVVTQSSTDWLRLEPRKGKQEVGEMDTACVSQAFVVSRKYFDWITERHQTSSFVMRLFLRWENIVFIFILCVDCRSNSWCWGSSSSGGEREEKIFTMGPLPVPLPGGHVGRWSHVISLSHGDTWTSNW